MAGIKPAAASGHIAARIDRLPLTRVQWSLAILVEITWGFIIVDTDGIGARLYPFVWRPAGIMTVGQYAVIQALQVGLGVLCGVYLMGWIADRYGRRPAILTATALGGVFLWPFAYVTNFWGLVILSVLSTLGVGGIVATHAVYLTELIGPKVRSRVLLASQGSTALVGIAVSQLAFWLIPAHWKEYVWIGAGFEVVLLLPLLWWLLPESPRWLEAMGREAEAETVMAAYEAKIERVTGVALEPPEDGYHAVVIAEDGAWKEIFTNPNYRSRTLLILACWVCCYPGLIYGVGAFAPVYMVDHGVTSHFVFGALTAGYVLSFIAFQFNAWLGERVERRDTLMLLGIVFSICWTALYFVPTPEVMAVGFSVGRVCTSLFLFNLYNYTAVSFPTRIRSVAFAWTDGLGHLGAWAGVTLTGQLYPLGTNHLAWVFWIVVPGALLPAFLIRTFGIRQARAVLEHVSK